jgi:hypothetical protein
MRPPVLTYNERRDSGLQWSLVLIKDRLYGEWVAFLAYLRGRPYGPCPSCSEAWIPSGDRQCAKCKEKYPWVQ